MNFSSIGSKLLALKASLIGLYKSIPKYIRSAEIIKMNRIIIDFFIIFFLFGFIKYLAFIIIT